MHQNNIKPQIVNQNLFIFSVTTLFVCLISRQLFFIFNNPHFLIPDGVELNPVHFKYLLYRHLGSRGKLFPGYITNSGDGNVMCVCLYQKSVCKVYRTEGVYLRDIQYIRISVFVQSRRVHLFIVTCLLKNKFNIHVAYYLYILKSTL